MSNAVAVIDQPNMKPGLRILATILLLVGAQLIITSCTDHVTTQSTAAASYSPGVPGGKLTQTIEVNATVTAVDSTTRKVTLVTRAGEKFAVTAGPEVANFRQIRVGDKLKVAYAEELVVRMARPGESTEDTGSAAAELAALGAKPGGSVSGTLQTAATVVEIDSQQRKVKLQYNDGTTKTVPVRDDIDLSKHRTGEKVIIRLTGALAVRMEKA